MRTRSNIEGFVLVGGASSRMGTNKALLELDNHTFVERIRSAMAPVVKKTTLIGSSSRQISVRMPTVSDVFEGWGALGGLHAALTNCHSEWALVLACDLPMVTRGLFERLASFRNEFDAVAPIQEDGFPQPLCAMYRTKPCRECAQQLIASGERRPRTLLRAVNARWVAANELEDLEGARFFFSNINTPEDYETIRQTVKG